MGHEGSSVSSQRDLSWNREELKGMNFLQTLTLALPQVYTKFAFPTLGKITRSLLLNLTHERGNNPPRQNRKKKGKKTYKSGKKMRSIRTARWLRQTRLVGVQPSGGKNSLFKCILINVFSGQKRERECRLLGITQIRTLNRSFLPTRIKWNTFQNSARSPTPPRKIKTKSSLGGGQRRLGRRQRAGRVSLGARTPAPAPRGCPRGGGCFAWPAAGLGGEVCAAAGGTRAQLPLRGIILERQK